MNSHAARSAIQKHLRLTNYFGITHTHIKGQFLVQERASMVHAIWNDIIAKNNNAKGVYILDTLYDCWEALDYEDSRDDRNLPYSCSMAFPCHYRMPDHESFQKQMLAYVTLHDFIHHYDEVYDGNEEFYGKHVTFFIDLPTNPTINSQLMLGRLIDLIQVMTVPAQDVGEKPKYWINLITIGADQCRHVVIGFRKFLDAHVHHIKMDPEPSMVPFDEREISGDRHQQNKHVLTLVQQLLDAYKQSNSLLVLFMHPNEARQIMNRIIHEFPQNLYKILTPGDHPEFIRRIKQIPELRLLIVDPTFDSVIGELPIANIVSTGTKDESSLDSQSGQFVRETKLLSQAELCRQRLWMETASTPDDVDAVYWTMYPPSKVPERSENVEDTFEHGLPTLLFWAIWTWSGYQFDRIPMPILRTIDKAAALDVCRCLERMDIMKLMDSDELIFESNDEICPLISRYLESEFNPNKSIPIATMLAHAKKLSAYSVKVARTISRFVAIITYDISELIELHPYDENDQFIEHGDLTRMALEECSGLGKRLGDHGSLWLALGLWQRGRDHREGDTPAWVHFPKAQNTIKLSNIHMYWIAKMADSLDRELGLPEEDGLESEKTMLNDEELEQVNEVLFISWINKLVVVSPDDDSGSVDLASQHPIDSSSRTLSLDQDDQRIEDFQSRGGYVAIYFTISKDESTGELHPQDLTRVPNAIFKKWKHRLGPLPPALLDDL